VTGHHGGVADENEEQSVERLIAEAIDAATRGDTAEARLLAGDALRRDPENRDAAEIARLADSSPAELRRLTIVFCDLVGSTAMSVRHDPGEYGRMLELYHRNCDDVISANGGRVTRRVGDGVLALFGHPVSYGDDTRRAVRAGRALVQRIQAVRTEVEAEFDDVFEVRVAVHHGLVHLDLVESQVYGLAPNLAARLQELAEPDQVVVSAQVASIVGELFTLTEHPPVELRGLDGPLAYFTVGDELPDTPRRGRVWASPFVGRLDEQDRIRRFADPAATAGPSMLVVQGEPGIGKSRVVHEALAGATNLPARILLGVCSAYERSDELRAIRPFLALSGTTEPGEPRSRLRQLRAELVTLGLDPEAHVPLLAPVLGLDPSAGYTPHASDLSRIRDLTVESIRAWLGAAAALGGVLLQVDDLQWADEASRAVLLGLARRPLDGVRVLATTRPDPLMTGGESVEVLELLPLGATYSLELATQVVPGIGRDALDRVLARGHGVPLFLEELAAAGEMKEVPPDMRARLSETSAVPGVLYEPLLARLSQPTVDLRVAQVAATIGTVFDIDVLGASMGRSRERLERSVGALATAGIVSESGPGVFQFRHGLVRDMAYDLQTTDDRRETHRRVGVALRASSSDRPEESWTVIAQHFHSAGSARDAVDAYSRAAAETRDLGALEAARRLLGTALELLETLPASDQRRLLEVTLRLQRAFLSVTMAGNADPHARADYDACEQLVQEHSAGPELVDTLVSLWGYYTALGSLVRSDELLDEIRATGVCDDPVYDAQNHGAKGLVAFLRGDFTFASRCFAAADAVRPPGVIEETEPSRWQFPNDPIAVEDAFRGVLAWQLGDDDAARRHLRNARHRAELLPFPHGAFSLCYVLHYGVWVDIENGDFDRARRSVDELIGLATRHGFDFWSVSAAMLSSTLKACVELARSTPDITVLRAENDQQSALRSVITMIDSQAFVPFGLTRQALVIDVIDGHEPALAMLDRAEVVAGQTGSHFYLAETWRTRAAVLRAVEPELSRHALGEAVRIAREQGAVVFERRALADLEAAVSDPGAA
jgi:class 3 adenylate cyclase